MPPRPAQSAEAAAAETRRLLYDGRAGVLSTTFRGRDAWPYGSLATYAPDVDGRPVFLFSTLSDHTNNLKKDGKASLLVERALTKRNPQRGPRATFLGRVKPTKSPRHRRRFLARHPEAEFYAGFGDFGFYVMEIERVHIVGGFAKAQWLKWGQVATPRAAVRAVQTAENGIVDHMNDDHADAIDLYANRLLGRKGTGWRLVSCDPWGLDLMRDGSPARLSFEDFPADAATTGGRGPVADPGAMRARLVALAARARKAAKE